MTIGDADTSCFVVQAALEKTLNAITQNAVAGSLSVEDEELNVLAYVLLCIPVTVLPKTLDRRSMFCLRIGCLLDLGLTRSRLSVNKPHNATIDEYPALILMLL